MNAIQLKQAVSLSLTKQVQEVAQAQMDTILGAMQQNSQQVVQASHPTLGKSIDLKM
ncbi:putative motility protein [Brevibacillus fortis]|uniref:putative motility protein n=1 Tax=Brevibacillus fortis TaxID=2126352 RepID=UPI002E1ADF14|nr:putative motility protein [Brevibacillus fortis]